MTISHFQSAVTVTKGVATVVTVSGQVISDFQFAKDSRCMLIVSSSGIMQESVGPVASSTITQIDSATDWIIPNGSAGGAYDVRYTSLTGDSLNGSTSLAEDIWGSLSGTKFFDLRVANGGGMLSASFTIEIRKDAGAVIDSATYTLAPESV